MGRNILALSALVFPLVACGGGGGGSSSPPPVIIAPTPVPPPAPPPPPPPPPPTSATVSYLHTFQLVSTGGGQPNGPLLQANDGNFYGTTRAGGANMCRNNTFPCGTVFKITPSGSYTELYSFGASPVDGYTPSGSLVQGADGALYGVTSSGGDNGAGTVFKITLTGAYNVLYSFGSSASDGIVPVGGLVQASDGNFFGVTASGGSNQCPNIPQAGTNCGTVFKISAAGTYAKLYSFGSSQADGVTPNGPLLQASDGNFYGTTVNGGANSCSTNGETNNCGTVFRITPSGAGAVVYSFGGSTTNSIAPQGPLIQGRDGALYGTTASGGSGICGQLFGCGTVFRLTLSGNASILHSFATSSRLDGYGPAPYLIQANDGNFYGTTRSGGTQQASQTGTAFRLTQSGIFTVLHSFGPLNSAPSDPLSGVIQGTDGAFYGVTAYSGISGTGTVFKLVLQ
jgi:uncharacterized repeat protein (TIGR03803 family)